MAAAFLLIYFEADHGSDKFPLLWFQLVHGIPDMLPCVLALKIGSHLSAFGTDAIPELKSIAG